MLITRSPPHPRSKKTPSGGNTIARMICWLWSVGEWPRVIYLPCKGLRMLKPWWWSTSDEANPLLYMANSWLRHASPPAHVMGAICSKSIHGTLFGFLCLLILYLLVYCALDHIMFTPLDTNKSPPVLSDRILILVGLQVSKRRVIDNLNVACRIRREYPPINLWSPYCQSWSKPSGISGCFISRTSSWCTRSRLQGHFYPSRRLVGRGDASATGHSS